MLRKKFISALLSKSNTKLLLFLIVIFGLVLRLIFFSGIGTSDDLAYSKYAANLDGKIPEDSSLTLSTRLGIIFVTAISYKLFGINDFSSVLFVLLTSIGSIILVFYFGKLLFNEKTGLMAAFLLSFFPLDVVYATKLFTDLPSAFFMALGVYIFLFCEIKSRFTGIGYLLSGILIGIGYLIRESVLLIGLFFVIYILYKKRIKKEYFMVVFGVLLVLVIEAIIFLAFTGDPLFRIHASQEYLVEALIGYNYFGRLDFPIGLLHYPYIILTSSLISYFYILIVIAIIYFIGHKRRETFSMMFWFISLLLYLSFGSSSFFQYAPFKAADRYLAVITIPGILLLALFLKEKKQFIKNFVKPIILIFLVLMSITSVYMRDDRNVLSDLKDASPYLNQLDKEVYMDARSARALDYISGYKSEIDMNPYPDSLKDLKDVYILINKRMINKLKEAREDREFPEEIENPPKSWTVVKEIGKEEENRIIVYYAS